MQTLTNKLTFIPWAELKMKRKTGSVLSAATAITTISSCSTHIDKESRNSQQQNQPEFKILFYVRYLFALLVLLLFSEKFRAKNFPYLFPVLFHIFFVPFPRSFFVWTCRCGSLSIAPIESLWYLWPEGRERVLETAWERRHMRRACGIQRDIERERSPEWTR